MTPGSGYVRKPPSCVYLILQINGEWWVDREGKSCGPCKTKEEAENSAFHLLELFGDPERRAEVWSPGDDGRMRLIWKGIPSA
jgi:hypothetical protein